MLGAMMQLMPVLMGIAIPQPVLFSRVIHVPLFLGSLCLGLAWLLQINQLFIVAMVLLGFSFVIFIGVAVDRLMRSKSTHATRSMMLLALLALLITACLGIYLAMGHAWQTFPLARYLTDLHLSWGMMGWVLLLVMAVAYQVIPMFQITDEYPAIHQRWMGWSVFAAMLGLSVAYLWQLEDLKSLSAMMLASCLLIFSLTTLWVLYKRRRKIADLTLNFWQLSMTSLVLLVLAWAIPTLLGLDLPVLLLGLLMIYGFAMTAVNGMMYKIIPFIIWLHLSARNKNLRDSGQRESQVKVPHMRKIIPEAYGLWQFRLHLVGLLMLALATFWPNWFYYPATLLFAIAQAALLFNLSSAVIFYNKKIIEISLVR